MEIARVESGANLSVRPGVDLELHRPSPEGVVTKHKADEWTIEHWKIEPRLADLEFSDAVDEAPRLWKALTLASAVAVLLWGAALVFFR
jgi:hypothetical protein